MSEASETLKKVMAAYPGIKKLAAQKEAMRQALINKGFTEDLFEKRLEDMREYGQMLAALDFSIDSAIKENGYTHDFGDGLTLSSVLKNKLLASTKIPDEYTYKTFYNNRDILYIPVRPFKASSASFWHAGASSLLYIPQLDYSPCTALYEGFSWNNTAMYVHDTYEVDLANCTTVDFSRFNMMKKLVLKNAGKCIGYSAIFQDCGNIEVVEGLDVSGVDRLSQSMLFRSSPITLRFAEGSIIRYANSIFAYYNSTGVNLYVDNATSPETVYNICMHAYDWKTNPRGLTKDEGEYVQNGEKYKMTTTLNFGSTLRAKVAQAYPGVDLAKIMEDKGWTY